MEILPTLSSLLDQAFPHLYRSVVEGEELTKLEFFQHQLLAPFRTALLLFECPLKGEKTWVDLSIRIDPRSEYFGQSIDCLKQATSHLATKDTWERCLHFLASHPLKGGFYGIELDTGSGGGNPLAPNLFLCSREFQGREFVLFVQELVGQLEGKKMSKQCAKHLDRHVEVCSSMGDQIFACGMMLARTGNGIRIHSSLNLHAALPALEVRLKKMGYARSIQPMLQILEKFPPDALTDLGLSLDIGEEIGPKMGIERFGDSSKFTRAEWEPLLAVLIQEGHASAKNVHACLNWVGGSRKTEDADRFSLFARRIAHVKLVSQPDKELQAKIYLNVVHKIISRA